MKQTLNAAESAEKSHAQRPVDKATFPQPQGTSWQLYFVVTVILVGVLGLIGKLLDLF